VRDGAPYHPEVGLDLRVKFGGDRVDLEAGVDQVLNIGEIREDGAVPPPVMEDDRDSGPSGTVQRDSLRSP
jgi:hypothetical protein